MADIQFYEADNDESSESGDDGLLSASDGYDSDTSNPDFGLGPIQKLEKYMLSKHSYTRQVIAKSLLETLKVVETSSDAEKVLQAMAKMASDEESSVRTEVMEQMTAISTYVHEMQHLFGYSSISRYVLPTIVKCLHDCNAQVRKTSQSSLIHIIQEKIACIDEVENMVIPIIMELAEPEGLDDFRAEAIMMMTKLAPLLGAELTVRSFLDRFLEMCTDSLFHVRKVCATNFGDMCVVVGSQITEQKLLPKFTNLCEDDVWGVRNACTECFMQVSKVCSMGVRREELSRLFTGLLSDQSRWVRMAAFQSLGAFISTFADPNYTGFDITDEGKIIPFDPFISSDSNSVNTVKDLNHNSGNSSNESRSLAAKKDEEEEPEFSTFNYWRPPIYDVLSASEGVLTQKQKEEETSGMNEHNCISGDASDKCTATVDRPSVYEESETIENTDVNFSEADSTEVCQDDNNCQEVSTHKDSITSADEDQLLNEDSANAHLDQMLYYESIPKTQNSQFAIPPELLQHYLSMVDSNRAQTVDTEILKHCAFSFPAVAFALGRKNWYLLKPVYELLARDLQWKVRRTLSFSIHELAVILGEEITTTDLLPIFDEFLKDLDEVRIGILKHLTDFLRLLTHDARRQYLPKIVDFLSTDNSRNWRFRMDLAEQLIDLIELFSPNDIVEHLSSVALVLADDKVAQVRYMSINVLNGILKKLSNNVCVQLWSDFVESVKLRFYQSNHYGRRQLFAHLCSIIIVDGSVQNECFVETFLPCLINLSQDKVPNVRLAVANCVFKHMVHSDYFLTSHHPFRESFQLMVDSLRNDPDSDVRNVFRDFAPVDMVSSYIDQSLPVDVPNSSQTNSNEQQTHVPDTTRTEEIENVDSSVEGNCYVSMEH